MGYLHMDMKVAATPKRQGHPSGDVVVRRRTAEFTWVILADGLGHGLTAHIDATLYASQLETLLVLGNSFREAFVQVVSAIHARRGQDMPYAAISAARIRNDGETTILTYDAPSPVFVGRQVATVLEGRPITAEGVMFHEAGCFLEQGEGLLLVSDGVTQAGMGRRIAGMPEGQTVRGLETFVNECLAEGVPVEEIAKYVLGRSKDLWGRSLGDDITAAMVCARDGQILTVLTGPPSRKAEDAAVVRDFLARPGLKVICGASTAQMVARFLGKRLMVQQDSSSAIAPPAYELDGVNLVTEGAVTLNQVLNILGEDPTRYEPDSGVSTLAAWLRDADRVDFIVGRAPNLGGNDIAFLQQGIQPRSAVVPMLMKSLEKSGKLVTCTWH